MKLTKGGRIGANVGVLGVVFVLKKSSSLRLRLGLGLAWGWGGYGGNSHSPTVT